MHDFADIKVIDAHTHAKNANSVANFVRLMESSGLGAINVASAPCASPGAIVENVLGAAFKATVPDQFYWFGGLHHTRPVIQDQGAPDYVGQAKRLWAMGCDGMKMLEGKPSIYKMIGSRPLNDPLYDDFYGWAEANRVPILFHVADPWRNWDPETCPQITRDRGWFYGDGTFPLLEELYDQVDEFMSRFPALPVIFAHFYFIHPDIQRAEAFFNRWPNVSYDLTPGGAMYKSFTKYNPEWRDFFIRFQDRILFGTDNNGGSRPDEDGSRVRKSEDKIGMIRTFLETRDKIPDDPRPPHVGFELDRPVLEKIYKTNFQRYAGDSPRPVDIQAALTRCRELQDIARDAGADENVLADLDGIAELLDQAQKKS